MRPETAVTPERHHEQTRFNLSVRPTPAIVIVHKTDVNTDMNTDWSENSAPRNTSEIPRLTEQDLLMAAGAVVFDCRPALFPVSVNVSGIDIRPSRSAISPAESVLVPPELQLGGGGEDLLDYIGPELLINEQPDCGTDLEDELPSPDGSPMVMSHGVSRLPARFEEVGGICYPAGDSDADTRSSRDAGDASH